MFFRIPLPDRYIREGKLKKATKSTLPHVKKKAKVETILQTSVKALSSIVFTTYRWRGYFRKLLFPEEKKRTFLGTHQCFFRDDFYTGRGAFLLFYCYYHYRGPIFFFYLLCLVRSPISLGRGERAIFEVPLITWRVSYPSD